MAQKVRIDALAMVVQQRHKGLYAAILASKFARC